MVRHGISFSNCAGYLPKSLIDEVFRRIDVFDYAEGLVMQTGSPLAKCLNDSITEIGV